jgi:hypothetical protein
MGNTCATDPIVQCIHGETKRNRLLPPTSYVRGFECGKNLGASRRIGYLIARAEGVFDTTGMFAGAALLALAVLVIGPIVSRLERRLLRWKPAQKSFRENQLR